MKCLIIVTIVQITSSWKCGNNLEPTVICRRSKAPVETMPDELSLTIIAEEVEAKRREKRTKMNTNIMKGVQLILRRFVIT